MHTNLVDNSQLRKFGLIFGAIVLVVFAGVLPFLKQKTIPTWSLVVPAVFFAIAIIYPKLLKSFYKLWIKIGDVLGWVNSRIILGIIYFGLLTPMALIKRIFVKDPLQKQFVDNQNSYLKASIVPEKQHMERPF